MSHQRFLPGFQTAPGPHRALVTRPDLAVPIRYHDAPCDALRAEVQDDLARKQRVARAVAPVALDPARLEIAASASWNVLRDRTNDWLDAHLASVDFSNFNPDLYPTPEAARRKILHAAHQGVTTIAAFQEVVPRTVAWRVDEPLTDPNAGAAQFAARSKGFVTEWLGLDFAVDYKLADALAIDPTGNEGTIFDDLHFDWIYFGADAVRREVRLDPEITAALQFGGEPLLSPAFAGEPVEEPLFGCPARKMIPLIFDAMHGQAVDRGLYGQTYLEERARYNEIQ